MITKKDYYTTSEVAKILQVAVGSVINWVDDNKINAIVTPGGHRKIPYKDLIDFLKTHNYDIPSKLLDKKLVYLVDDEESIHTFFKKVFEKMDNTDLRCFLSGTEALISIGRQIPQIIIVDILMPDIDGIQVIKNIKSKQELSKVYIIAISADINKKPVAIESGANLFLKKPFDLNEFKEAILNT